MEKINIPEIRLSAKLSTLKEINQSGEGIIYRIDDKHVLKVFFDQDVKNEKILTLEKAFHQKTSIWQNVKPFAAVPEYLAKNEKGQTVGYVMENLEGWLELNELYDEDLCNKSDIRIKTILHIFGLLHEALENIHSDGFVVEDLNGSNILLSPFGTDLAIKIVDTDSWSINLPNLEIKFNPTVQDPEVIHPDHLKAQLEGKAIPPFLPKHDWWAFSYLLSKCLTKRDPFEEGNFWNLDPEQRRQAGKTTMHADIIINRDMAIRHLQIGITLKHFIKRWLACSKEGVFPINLLKATHQEMSTCKNCKIEVNSRLTSCPNCSVLL